MFFELLSWCFLLNKNFLSVFRLLSYFAERQFLTKKNLGRWFRVPASEFDFLCGWFTSKRDEAKPQRATKCRISLSAQKNCWNVENWPFIYLQATVGRGPAVWRRNTLNLQSIFHRRWTIRILRDVYYVWGAMGRGGIFIPHESVLPVFLHFSARQYLNWYRVSAISLCFRFFSSINDPIDISSSIFSLLYAPQSQISIACGSLVTPIICSHFVFSCYRCFHADYIDWKRSIFITYSARFYRDFMTSSMNDFRKTG